MCSVTRLTTLHVLSAMIFIGIGLIVLAGPAGADNVPLQEWEGSSPLLGDSPPATTYTFSGNGGLATSVVGLGPSGTFTIAGIPATGSVVKALFITGIWDFASATHSMTFTFGSTFYGTLLATTLDIDDGGTGGLDLAGYVVDVTADVPGNGSYTFVAAPDQSGTGAFGSLLVVIYSDASSPAVQIHLNTGSESLAFSGSTSTFAGVAAGAATLHVFTQADQAGTSTGVESIAFNGATILGGTDADIFNNNVALFTSYFALGVTTVAGANTTTITTGEDWLGWQVAALVSPGAPTSTESRTWGSIKGLYR